MAELADAARRGVPVLVANPDLEMLTPAGIRASAGAVARALAGCLGPDQEQVDHD